jgi:hypothetical protein
MSVVGSLCQATTSEDLTGHYCVCAYVTVNCVLKESIINPEPHLQAHSVRGKLIIILFFQYVFTLLHMKHLLL